MYNLDSNKRALEDMLFYYIYAMIKNGVEDPKQVIATELGEIIDLSEEQLEYVKLNVLEDNKVVNNLDCCIKLLDNMQQSKTLDLDSLSIVLGILNVMKEHAEQSTENFISSVEDYEVFEDEEDEKEEGDTDGN